MTFRDRSGEAVSALFSIRPAFASGHRTETRAVIPVCLGWRA